MADTLAPSASPAVVGRSLAPVRRWYARLPRTNSLLIGGFMVLVLVLMALVGPLVETHNPLALDIAHKLQGPSLQYPLGTDQLGRDMLARIMYGSRGSLQVAIVTVLIAFCIGVPLGAISGYFGGFSDTGIMRIMDTFMAFPALLLAIGLVAAIGPGLTGIMLVLGIVYIPVFARLIRSSVIIQRDRDYIIAARTIGQREWRILQKHVLPNAISPIAIQITITLGEAIYLEAALSFLGLGVQPPAPSWGSMLNESRGFMQSAPHAAIFPGLVVALAVLGFNLLGDGLRDLLDPRLRRLR